MNNLKFSVFQQKLFLVWFCPRVFETPKNKKITYQISNTQIFSSTQKPIQIVLICYSHSGHFQFTSHHEEKVWQWKYSPGAYPMKHQRASNLMAICLTANQLCCRVSSRLDLYVWTVHLLSNHLSGKMQAPLPLPQTVGHIWKNNYSKTSCVCFQNVLFPHWFIISEIMLIKCLIQFQGFWQTAGSCCWPAVLRLTLKVVAGLNRDEFSTGCCTLEAVFVSRGSFYRVVMTQYCINGKNAAVL